jgi:hypothetical protein
MLASTGSNCRSQGRDEGLIADRPAESHLGGGVLGCQLATVLKNKIFFLVGAVGLEPTTR